jgi:4-aminobutyrate aminotransferase
LIMRKDLAIKLDDMSQPQTFAANAVSAAVTLTNLDIIEEGELVERAAQLGDEVMVRLKQASEKLAIIGEVRGRGLMIGIELVKDKESREPADGDTMMKVVMGLLSSGIIMVPCGRYGNVLRLMPSLTITREYMNKAVDILLDVLGDV